MAGLQRLSERERRAEAFQAEQIAPYDQVVAIEAAAVAAAVGWAFPVSGDAIAVRGRGTSADSIGRLARAQADYVMAAFDDLDDREVRA